MRVEGYTPIQPIYKNPRVDRGGQVSTPSAARDQLQISSIGKDIQTAKAALAGSPDIREDLTAPIRRSIQNDTYQVDNGSFAEKLLEKYKAVV